MLWIFQSLAERCKTMFALDVASDFEAEFLSRQADRKAELFRQAKQLDEQGLEDLAAELRYQAETLSLQKPLAAVREGMTYLAGTDQPSDSASLEARGQLPSTQASKPTKSRRKRNS